MSVVSQKAQKPTCCYWWGSADQLRVVPFKLYSEELYLEPWLYLVCIAHCTSILAVHTSCLRVEALPEAPHMFGWSMCASEEEKVMTSSLNSSCSSSTRVWSSTAASPKPHQMLVGRCRAASPSCCWASEQDDILMPCWVHKNGDKWKISPQSLMISLLLS